MLKNWEQESSPFPRKERKQNRRNSMQSLRYVAEPGDLILHVTLFLLVLREGQIVAHLGRVRRAVAEDGRSLEFKSIYVC